MVSNAPTKQIVAISQHYGPSGVMNSHDLDMLDKNLAKFITSRIIDFGVLFDVLRTMQ